MRHHVWFRRSSLGRHGRLRGRRGGRRRGRSARPGPRRGPASSGRCSRPACSPAGRRSCMGRLRDARRSPSPTTSPLSPATSSSAFRTGSVRRARRARPATVTAPSSNSARSGRALRTWELAGKCDGLTADPLTGRVIATVNEDAHSSLYLINPRGGAAHYRYSKPLPSKGGTDAISIYRRRVLISASAPGTTGAAPPRPTYPAVYSAKFNAANHVVDDDPDVLRRVPRDHRQRRPRQREAGPAGARRCRLQRGRAVVRAPVRG